MGIRQKKRETFKYALNQPTMLRVSIKSGEVLEDKRAEYFGTYYNYTQQGEATNGNGAKGHS